MALGIDVGVVWVSSPRLKLSPAIAGCLLLTGSWYHEPQTQIQSNGDALLDLSLSLSVRVRVRRNLVEMGEAAHYMKVLLSAAKSRDEACRAAQSATDELTRITLVLGYRTSKDGVEL